MYERVLQRMRSRIRARRYVMTVHAWDEMDDDGLSVFDLENAILSGRIVGRQTDQPFGDRKYLIRGRPFVVLTVYTEES